MNCQQFRAKLNDGKALESTFQEREAIKDHLDSCPHCQEWASVMTECHDGTLTPEEEEACRRIREADEKKTKHPMNPKQKKLYGMQ